MPVLDAEPATNARYVTVPEWKAQVSRRRLHVEGQLSLFDFLDVPSEVSELKVITAAVEAAVYNGFTFTSSEVMSSKPLTINELCETVSRDTLLTRDEKIRLAAFGGWGAFSKILNGPDTGHYCERRVAERDITAAFGGNAVASIGTATLDSYFTSPGVVTAMWRAAAQYGFKGGRVLEPSAGFGAFIGLCPLEIRANSQFWALEKDSVSTKVLSKLYGDDVRIINAGFEDQVMPNGYFDLVIGNVPFGSQTLSDAERGGSRAVIHDFFIQKSLRKLRPGGIAMLITTSRTLDKTNATARSVMAEYADLVNAVRLPSSVFAASGAAVTTDILVFRKRTSYDVPSDAWVDTYHVAEINGERISMGSFFESTTTHVLGEIQFGEDKFGKTRLTCKGDVPSEHEILKALTAVPISFKGPQAPTIAQTPASCGMAEGSYQLDATTGRVVMVRDGLLTELDEPFNGPKAKRIVSLIGVRDCLKALLTKQNDPDAGEDEIAGLRDALNVSYDTHDCAYGRLSDLKNRSAMDDDPSYPLLLSLEIWDEENEMFLKAPIFSVRTTFAVTEPDSANSLSDAAILSLAQRSRVDVAYVAKLLRADELETFDALSRLDGYFLDPTSREIQIADQYLSGNVKTKHAEAVVALKEELVFARNVVALAEVIPADIPAHDIKVRLGQGWIPAPVYAQWVLESTGQAATFTYYRGSASWGVSTCRKLDEPNSATNRVTYSQALDSAMNSRSIEVTDKNDDGKHVVNADATLAVQAFIAEMQEKFATWIWQDEERAKALSKRYNDEFNAIISRNYDGKHLVFPGMSQVYTPRGNQRNAVWRALQSWNTLFDHFVGAGKTLILAALAMELRRTGMATKPLIVVANRTLPAFTAEFMRIYPGAKVLMMGRDDMDKTQRKRFVGRVATGDWDAIIMAQSVFDRIGVRSETLKEYADSVGDGIRNDAYTEDKNSMSRRSLLAKAQQIENKIKQMQNASAKDDHVLFEDLGVDYLLVDEAHAYKNLYVQTKMVNVAGVATGESQRAINMLLKVRHVYKTRRANKGVVFATATPLTNTMTEVYVMMSYLAPEVLASFGLQHFDAWAAHFGRIVADVEVSPDGSSFRMKKRFSQFQNVPELASMCSTFWDAVFPEDVKGLQRPEMEGGKPIVVSVTASDEQKAFIRTLAVRAERMRIMRVDPAVDNMLKVVSDGAKCALDMRLIDPTLEDFEGSKLNACIRNVYEIWAKTAAHKSTQIIFSDLGVNDLRGFSVYADIRRKLIDKGIPEAQIAVAQDYSTDRQVSLIDRQFNAGKVRIMLGSTSVLGIGRNVQKRLIAWHHIDAPYRADEVEQRDGRGIRHGNTHKLVFNYRYVTEGSFDSFKWQTVERKARFTAAFRRNGSTDRVMEDLDSNVLSYAEVKAIASGNAAVREMVTLQSRARLLEAKLKDHEARFREANHSVTSIPNRIDVVERLIKDYSDAIAARPTSDAGYQPMTINGTSYKDARVFALALESLTLSNKAQDSHSNTVCGEFGPYVLVLRSHGQGFELRLGEASVYTGATHHDHIVSRLIAITADFESDMRSSSGLLRNLRERLVKSRSDVASLQSETATAIELDSVLMRLDELQADAASMAV